MLARALQLRDRLPQLMRALGDLLLEIVMRITQPYSHLVERFRETLELIAGTNVDAPVPGARADLRRGGMKGLDGTYHSASEEDAQQQSWDQCHQQKQSGHEQGLIDGREGLGRRLFDED